jgi:hypothetical protein
MKIFGIMNKTSICYGHGDYRGDLVWGNHPFFDTKEKAEAYNETTCRHLGQVVECELL